MSPRSIPVQNERSPAAVSTAARTAGFALIEFHTAASSCSICVLKQLWTSARFSVTTATPSSSRYSRVSSSTVCSSVAARVACRSVAAGEATAGAAGSDAPRLLLRAQAVLLTLRDATEHQDAEDGRRDRDHRPGEEARVLALDVFVVLP